MYTKVQSWIGRYTAFVIIMEGCTLQSSFSCTLSDTVLGYMWILHILLWITSTHTTDTISRIYSQENNKKSFFITLNPASQHQLPVSRHSVSGCSASRYAVLTKKHDFVIVNIFTFCYPFETWEYRVKIYTIFR